MNSGLLIKFKNAVRLWEWWSYKLPILFIPMYFLLNVLSFTLLESIFVIAQLLIWMFSAAAFGYFLNECFDIKSDFLAKKQNQVVFFSTKQRSMILICLAITSISPFIFAGMYSLLTLCVVHLGLFFLYSAPPFRWKEKGFLGVITDSCYAYIVPSIIVVFFVLQSVEIPQQEVPFINDLLTVVFFIWLGIQGLRNILIHQMQDYQNDLVSNTTTWVTQLGNNFTAYTLYCVIFPLEILCYSILSILLNYLLLVFFVAFLLWQIHQSNLWESNEVDRIALLGYDTINTFYEIWLGILVICLFGKSWCFLHYFLAIHFALFHNRYLPPWVFNDKQK